MHQVIYIYAYICIHKIYVCVLVTQSCPTLCNPRDYSLPCSSSHGLLQARILQVVMVKEGGKQLY